MRPRAESKDGSVDSVKATGRQFESARPYQNGVPVGPIRWVELPVPAGKLHWRGGYGIKVVLFHQEVLR